MTDNGTLPSHILEVESVVSDIFVYLEPDNIWFEMSSDDGKYSVDFYFSPCEFIVFITRMCQFTDSAIDNSLAKLLQQILSSYKFDYSGNCMIRTYDNTPDEDGNDKEDEEDYDAVIHYRYSRHRGQDRLIMYGGDVFELSFIREECVKFLGVVHQSITKDEMLYPTVETYCGDVV
jgi:hypothetical protein